MGKDLSEMTLEELWELFPIFLVAHDDRWKDNFNEIEKTLTGDHPKYLGWVALERVLKQKP